jgi:hypothetical protein
MTATFPSSVRNFTAKVDIQDTILADHVNSLQDEVRAVETTIGTSPLTSVYTGTFSQTATWPTLSARLANIEYGLVNGTGSGTAYVGISGGSTVTASAGLVGLTLQNVSGNLSNIISTKTSAGAIGFNVDYNGIPKVGTYNVLYVNSSDYTTLAATTATALSTANAASAAATAAAAQVSASIHPFLLSGM